MTTSIPASAAAARESARTSTGQFGTQPRTESELELATPEPFVQLTTLESSMTEARQAVLARGWALGPVTWPRESGEENKRTDYIPTEVDAAKIRTLLEVAEDAPVEVYWSECERYDCDEDLWHHTSGLTIEAGNRDAWLDEDSEPAAMLGALFTELDAG